MTRTRFRCLAVSCALAAAVLAACGDGQIGGPTTCTTAQETSALFALASDWYLYQDLVPGTTDYQQLVSTPFDLNAYATPTDMLDAFTAAARAKNEDRYWTYLLTKQVSQQYFQDGESAGFGIEFLLPASGAADPQVLVLQVMRGSPADQAGFRRGDAVVAVGDSATTMTAVATLAANGTLSSALDAGAPGTPRYFSVIPVGETTAVTRSMAGVATYDLDPVVSSVVESPAGRKVGYVLLRTFVSPAEDRLRSAFATFKQQGVTDVVIDERYNGGGLVDTAKVLASLLHPRDGDLMYSGVYNARHADQEWDEKFSAEDSGIASLAHIAFITTSSTASASELVINALGPYLGANLAIVGDRTYGKPVGQKVLTVGPCQDELHLIAFRLQNAAGFGGYYDGLPDAAGAFGGTSCAAPDDLTHQLGDPAEASLAQALAFIDGVACAPIASASTSATAARASRLGAAPPAWIQPGPRSPSPAQRDIPGLF